MHKINNKRCLRVLSSAAIGILIASAVTATNVHAAVKSYVVNHAGKVISFNSDTLLQNYANKLSDAPSPMFDEYLKDAGDLYAFQDTVKGFVSADSVEAAYTAVLGQNKNDFNIDNFTENASTADIINITVGYECNNDGTVVPITNTMPTATVEQAGTAIMGKTAVIASLPSNVDPSKYDVTVNGTKLVYDSKTGKFNGTLNGTFSIQDLQNRTTVNLNENNTSDNYDVDIIY